MDYILQIIASTAVLGALYALLALGFNLLYSTNKFFDLSYAAYLIIGAYAYLALATFGLPLWATFASALFATLLVAYLVETLLYAGLRHKKSSPAVMMIASLGILTVVQGIIALIFTSNIQTLSATNRTLSLGWFTMSDVQLALILCAVLAYIASYIVLKKTHFGIQLRALADSEELATTSGLPVKKIRLITTLLGVAIGATAAILYGMDTSFDPYTGMQLLLKGVVVAIISGLGSITYGAVGALLLAVVESLVIWHLGAEWRDAVAFLILISILLVRPTGILKK